MNDMNVQVFDEKNNKVIGVFSIALGGVNYVPTNDELFEEAWKCAVEDGLVDQRRKKDYHFKVLD